MLYKKSHDGQLDKKLFEHPSSEYRGAPFWGWNCAVTPEIIKKQIGIFMEMGFGGYHIHPRTGMETPYLSDEYLSLIRFAVEESERAGTFAWLYDEDRWPSGFAGGLVTSEPKYRQRALRLTKTPLAEDIPSKEEAVKTGKPFLFGAYDISLNDAGELSAYRKIAPSEKADGEKWYAYCECTAARGWFNGQTYVDTLSKEAIDRFIEVTHERYKGAVGQEFGKTVPAIFTDEPQLVNKGCFAFAKSGADVPIPWTPELDTMYFSEYSENIGDTLPELFWNRADGEASEARYRYHNFLCETFTKAFADNCGDWCEKNGLALTGHMMAEDALSSQTKSLGEAMRSDRAFQLPGIDMLLGWHMYTTAKQCQSAVHQYGREGMMSELYGVTDWDFDFRGHKHHGDWQAALGVTLRVHSVSLMSLSGDRKRDYPASIFYQSPWYKEYSYIEDHFARLASVLTRGEPCVDVAVIHPVESYWLHWGPYENTGSARERFESNFTNITEWLLFGGIDFDFISESLLPELYGGSGGNELIVGKMKYKAVVVPALETMRESTLKVLEDFKKAGGVLIFMGDMPRYIDAKPSDAARQLYDVSEKIHTDRAELLSALSGFRRVEMRNSGGDLTKDYLYNYRKNDNGRDWLFVCRGKERPSGKVYCAKYHVPEELTITLSGKYSPVLWDTLTGKTEYVDYIVSGDKTVIKRELYDYDSLLLELKPFSPEIPSVRKSPKTPLRELYLDKPSAFSLDEPNAMLLDRAEYRVDTPSLDDSAEWLPEEEMLRLYDAAAKLAGLPEYDEKQPWTAPPEILSHHVDLKLTINSDIDYEGARLALENAPLCEVRLNGEPAGEIDGWFTDESIPTIRLPKITRGENTLLIRSPIGVNTRLEWCYILGGFGVRLAGRRAAITTLPETLGFSSITGQLLPFYTGNIEYDEDIEMPDCSLEVRVSEYRGALVRVFLDGVDKGVIAFDPYRLKLGNVPAGRHRLTFRCYGTRFNIFGALHNTNTSESWVGPKLWKTTGDSWCYEYRLRDAGILAEPVLYIYERES